MAPGGIPDVASCPTRALGSPYLGVSPQRSESGMLSLRQPWLVSCPRPHLSGQPVSWLRGGSLRTDPRGAPSGRDPVPLGNNPRALWPVDPTISLSRYADSAPTRGAFRSYLVWACDYCEDRTKDDCGSRRLAIPGVSARRPLEIQVGWKQCLRRARDSRSPCPAVRRLAATREAR